MSKYTQKRIRIVVDEFPTNPREDTEYNHMVCFHSKYNLGDTDKSLGYSKKELKDRVNGWGALKKILQKEHNTVVILPLYLYDHGGITMNTTGFSCPWDSGQVGFIYVTKEDIEASYPKFETITSKRKALLKECLLAVVDVYDHYLRGECYGYVLEELTCEKCGTWEEIESCYGFVGPYKTSGLLEYARQEMDQGTPVFDTDGTLIDP